MKKLLTSTAVFIALAGTAIAQSEQTAIGTVKMTDASLLVGDMIGEPIYNFRGRPNTDAPMPLDGAERFERVATIRDVMINTDGTVEALVIGVGGFWGLADREVTAEMEGITVVTDVRGDRYFVIYSYDETLKDARRFNKFDISGNSLAEDGAFLTASSDNASQSPVPIPQDPDATIPKAKPADEMLGDTAPTGTTLDVDPDSATVDGVPRDAESGFVNTDRNEAEVGIPDSEGGVLADDD